MISIKCCKVSCHVTESTSFTQYLSPHLPILIHFDNRTSWQSTAPYDLNFSIFFFFFSSFKSRFLCVFLVVSTCNTCLLRNVEKTCDDEVNKKKVLFLFFFIRFLSNRERIGEEIKIKSSTATRYFCGALLFLWRVWVDEWERKGSVGYFKLLTWKVNFIGSPTMSHSFLYPYDYAIEVQPTDHWFFFKETMREIIHSSLIQRRLLFVCLYCLKFWRKILHQLFFSFLSFLFLTKSFIFFFGSLIEPNTE